MEQKVIEGTWEEVTQRGQELVGHRVRVTVLDDLALPTATNGTHADEATEATAFDVMSRAGLIGCLKGGPIDPILGMFSDDARLLDDVVEGAMKTRERRGGNS
jgi:hypothetical protein